MMGQLWWLRNGSSSTYFLLRLNMYSKLVMMYVTERHSAMPVPANMLVLYDAIRIAALYHPLSGVSSFVSCFSYNLNPLTNLY